MTTTEMKKIDAIEETVKNYLLTQSRWSSCPVVINDVGFLLKAFRVMRKNFIEHTKQVELAVPVATNKGFKILKGEKAVDALFESRMK